MLQLLNLKTGNHFSIEFCEMIFMILKSFDNKQEAELKKNKKNTKIISKRFLKC